MVLPQLGQQPAWTAAEAAQALATTKPVLLSSKNLKEVMEVPNLVVGAKHIFQPFLDLRQKVPVPCKDAIDT